MGSQSSGSVQSKNIELNVNEQDIDKRKSYVGLTKSDVENIQYLKPIIEKKASEITTKFFEYLLSFPETKKLFSSSALEEAKRMKYEHLIALAGGDYGQGYFDQRIKLARLYSKVGLAPSIFFGAFQYLLSSLSSIFYTEFSSKKEEMRVWLASLQKVVFLDLGMIVDVITFDREQTIRVQQDAIKELSIPVLQLNDRLLMLPIVGMLDSYRAKILTENLLKAIRDKRAKVVVLDITGVATIDSKVANHLVQTVTASKLMGAKTIVTGLSAEIAQTLVTLGVDVSKLNTVGDLQGGLEVAEYWLEAKPEMPGLTKEDRKETH